MQIVNVFLKYHFEILRKKIRLGGCKSQIFVIGDQNVGR